MYAFIHRVLYISIYIYVYTCVCVYVHIYGRIYQPTSLYRLIFLSTAGGPNGPTLEFK